VQIKLSSPTILPSKALPYLSFQNRLITSPKDYTALFDLAAAGPITGLTVSFLALLTGLQLTTTVDPATAQLLPSLPVGFICQSSLGGTLVDMILGGGDGILINQEAATQIPLHPIAIAGFVGMIINALDLLPIGSTDGGRMSQVSDVKVEILLITNFSLLAIYG
jgi:membrane-associated protease RseP (regulator of RpoE activity)